MLQTLSHPMKTAHQPRERLTTFAKANVEVSSRFNALIAHDDASMGIWAKHVFSNVTRHLEPGCQAGLEVWKFNTLQMPAPAASAPDDAVAANMIILAAREQNEVPHAVRKWIETWLARRAGAEGTLALLLEPALNASTANSPTRIYLREVGQRGNPTTLKLTDPEEHQFPRGAWLPGAGFTRAEPPALTAALAAGW